jgi:hypothetical protein
MEYELMKQLKRGKKIKKAELRSLFPNLPTTYEEKAFYEQLGRTNAAWQLVEQALYEIYSALMASKRPGAVAAAFFSIPSFNTSLAMTHQAACFVLFDKLDLLQEWKSIRSRAKRKLNHRNKVAHGAVWVQFQEPEPDRKIYLGPNISDPSATLDAMISGSSTTDPLTRSKLKRYQQEFATLAIDMRSFSAKVPPQNS